MSETVKEPAHSDLMPAGAVYCAPRDKAAKQLIALKGEASIN
jgi:hypothetical protein